MQFELTERGIRSMGEEMQTPEGPAFFPNIITNGEGGDPRGDAPPPEPQALPGVVPNEQLQAFAYPGLGKTAHIATPLLSSPEDIVKAAKRRAKELRANLRQAKRWQKELGKLERMIAAADGKQLAAVRNIDSRRAG